MDMTDALRSHEAISSKRLAAGPFFHTQVLAS
jgi:hypothetical protein